MEAGDGIEPTIRALQAPALPLCYPAQVTLCVILLFILINKILLSSFLNKNE